MAKISFVWATPQEKEKLLRMHPNKPAINYGKEHPAKFFLAKTKGKIDGFAIFEKTSLSYVYIEKEFRNIGIGEKLTKQAVKARFRASPYIKGISLIMRPEEGVSEKTLRKMYKRAGFFELAPNQLGMGIKRAQVLTTRYDRLREKVLKIKKTVTKISRLHRK